MTARTTPWRTGGAAAGSLPLVAAPADDDRRTSPCHTYDASTMWA